MIPKYIHTIHPSGFPISFEITPEDPELKPLIDYLIHYGFRPADGRWLRCPEEARILADQRKPALPLSQSRPNKQLEGSHNEEDRV